MDRDFYEALQLAKEESKKALSSDNKYRRELEGALKESARLATAHQRQWSARLVTGQSYSDRMIADLKHLKIDVVYMKGDGNCLFRCFAYVVKGTQDAHKEVRSEICNFIKTHENVFKPFIDISVEKYVDIMKKDGEWGGHIELKAASDKYSLDIRVFVVINGKKKLREQLLPSNGAAVKRVANLLYKSDHYNVLSTI